jgi:tRNA 2-thiouridine synthesizing protein A
MTRTLDLRGLRCPWPALRTAAAMRDSDALIVMVDDPEAPAEIAALAMARDWQLRSEAAGFLQLSATPANGSLSSIAVD